MNGIEFELVDNDHDYTISFSRDVVCEEQEEDVFFDFIENPEHRTD